jgi:uncharacterized protein Yka (UPF0111/DUF47 family)
VFNFLPKDDKFFDQLDTLARMLVNATEQLSAILQTFPKFDPQRNEIDSLRQRAADLAQDSLAILDKAFITPLDREDILALIDGMNSVIQEIAELAERFALYPLESLYPNLTAQSRNLLELAIQVEEIMAGLRKKTTLSELANGSMKKLQAIENNVRRDRKEFLGELFRGNSDPIDLIKKKDLHDLLEESLLRMSRITQVLARVLLKNT